MFHKVSMSDVINSYHDHTLINHKEITELDEEWSTVKYFKAELEIGDDYFDHWNHALKVKKNRRGEAALFVQDENENILLHTKPFYPNNIFRIPTGGILVNEDVVAGMQRELQEETGFKTLSFKFSAILVYELNNDSRKLSFPSYIFTIRPDGSNPKASDEEEQISGYSWASISNLGSVVDQLNGLKGLRWADWGRVRAVPHEIFLDHLLA